MKQMVLPIGWPAPVSKISQERLPTNTTTRHHPVHRWFNFIAGFSPEFVSQCISSTQASEQQVLLDPFSGCGTAQVEGLRHGMKAIGFEPHPIFFRIARAKTIAAVPDLAAIEKTIRYGFRHPCNVDELGPKPAEFLSKLIPQESLEKMVGARLALQSSAHCNSDIAFLVLSKVLDSVSHSATDGVYKAPATFKKSHDITAALESIINIIAEDCEFRGSQSQSSCKLVNSSSESMTLVRSNSVDLVVTSPPYLNNFDYAEMTRMYLYFWGIATSWGQINEKTRSKLIVNTTTALKGHKVKQSEYRARLPADMQSALVPLVSELAAARKVKAGKKEYDYLVYPYFAQLQSVLRECARVMKLNSDFHMMVADAALYGVHIPAPQLLATLLQAEGFADVRCELVRKRGHRWILTKRQGSSEGLGEYHVYARWPK